MNMPKGGNYVKLCCSPKMSKFTVHSHRQSN